MIGDGRKVQRSVDHDGLARLAIGTRQLQRLAFGVTIGVVGAKPDAGDIGIKAETGVDMEIPEQCGSGRRVGVTVRRCRHAAGGCYQGRGSREVFYVL